VKKGIESARIHCSDDNMFSRRMSSLKDPYFLLKARNGERIGTSIMYNSAADREEVISLVKKYALEAEVEEMA
jgi:uncharacterized protein YegP (UPF0339 family)